MANDLERFLQQAAERLAEKMNQGRGSAQQPPEVERRPVRERERTSRHLEAQVFDEDIIDAELLEQPNRRELGPNPLSNLDTRPGLAQEIGMADERMAEHLRDVFDQKAARRTGGPRTMERGPGETEKKSELQRRDLDVSPLVAMLRQPESLRAAFIAGEIFRRKFN